MRQDGIQKVADGVTTIDEVLRATQDVEDEISSYGYVPLHRGFPMAAQAMEPSKQTIVPTHSYLLAQARRDRHGLDQR